MRALQKLTSNGRVIAGILRSLATYYIGSERRHAMDRLYSRFIHPGDLVFDIGSHVGDRVASFRRLGAKVVAVEPQAALARTLHLLYKRDPCVSIERFVIGATTGQARFFLNLSNPTVSTASAALIAAAQASPGWDDQVWERRIRLPQTTLDALIERHGFPAFMKIDIEGFEAEALAGLSFPIPAFSFEFTTIQRAVARQCLAACQRLGAYRFKACLGESQHFVLDRWICAEEIGTWLDELPHEANSGDIYAALVEETVAHNLRRTE